MTTNPLSFRNNIFFLLENLFFYLKKTTGTSVAVSIFTLMAGKFEIKNLFDKILLVF
jgi:hypothetical protein